MEELESGKHTAVSVKELLQKLRIPDENILYYADGIRLLTALMQDCEYPQDVHISSRPHV